MCGIAGSISFGRAQNEGALQEALDLLSARGPDHRGEWRSEDGSALMGHRRLSIFDLSEAANQPMVSADRRYTVSFNGEVYNFREIRASLRTPPNGWRSESDTEVILEAFAQLGHGCLDRFRGMFAFSIWDSVEKRLFAARDRFGVKPFYYSDEKDEFHFASRPKAVLALKGRSGGRIDVQACRLYLESGYVPAPRSIYEDIRKLPAGHYLYWSRGRIHIERWWDFRGVTTEHSLVGRAEETLLDELDQLVDRSVRYRMESDVPVGAFLSGGIDSSLVVSSMQKQSVRPVKTFAVGFHDASHDESSYAEAVARHFGCDHTTVMLSEGDLLALLPDFRRHFDEPFSDSAAFPTMAVSKVASQHVKVSLSGDGGDELFGGYHYYRFAELSAPLFQMPYPLRRGLSQLVRLWPSHKVKLLASALSAKTQVEAIAFARSILKDFQSPLIHGEIEGTDSLSDLFERDALAMPSDAAAGEIAARLDIGFTLQDDYLQKVDVATMAYSLEGREPLLDHELADWALRLPWSFKNRNGVGKYLLRRCAYRRMPRHLIDRPKKGFEVPLGKWMRGPLREWVADTLASATLYRDVPLDKRVVMSLLEQHQSGRRNVQPMLWALVILADFLAVGRS